MKIANVSHHRYRDNLARARRRRFIAAGVAIGIGVIALLVSSLWAIFFSRWLAVDQISITGLSGDQLTTVNTAAQSEMDQTHFKLPIGRNMIFFPTAAVRSDLLKQFTFLQDIQVQKHYPHEIVIVAQPRLPRGTWCRGVDCRYFDTSGVTWGNPPPSSGTVLLSIADDRVYSASTPFSVDTQFLNPITQAVDGLTQQHILVTGVTIPAGSFTEFDAQTTLGTLIKFGTDSNIQSQLTALQIFLGQQPTAASLSFQYLDLRFDGRVYYK